jgi:hypothetical protein
MGFCHYDYIRSPEWYTVRAKVLTRDHCECAVCGYFSIWNEVHHDSYKNVKTTQEKNDCLTICRRHHEGIHNTLYYMKMRQ